jgi:hypothetical protein
MNLLLGLLVAVLLAQYKRVIAIVHFTFPVSDFFFMSSKHRVELVFSFGLFLCEIFVPFLLKIDKVCSLSSLEFI